MLPLRPLLAAAVFALAGCGTVAPLTSPGAVLGAPGALAKIGKLSDFPEIAAQLARFKTGADARGTRVSELPKPAAAKAVTFLTYKALDNNLGLTLEQHLNVLEHAGSSTRVNALALTDDIGPRNTFKYYLSQDADPDTITSPYAPFVKSGADLDTGSGASLTRAMRWGFGDYPAKLRWLDVNDHGGGYYGVAQDDQKNSIIRLPELAKALASGGKVDVLSFDACLMASAEVSYELRGAARYMVASEDSSYALGMNYDQTLAALAAGGASVDPQALARDLVLRAQRKGSVKALFTISAIDLGKAEAVTKAVDALAGALIAAYPKEKAAIALSLKAVQPFHVGGADGTDFNHRDLNEVVVQLKERVGDPGVRQAAASLNKALFNQGGAILLSRATREQNGVARGLSIYLPTDGKIDPIYLDTAFAKATRWDEFLALLGK